MHTKDFLHALNDEKIAHEIAEAEKRTSGEIRVFVSDKLIDDPVKEAEKQFIALGMARTERHNGVLIYFAPQSQKYAVLGDKAVHEKCGQKFWEHITHDMTPLLKAGQFTDAVVLAVREIGAVLQKEFPWASGDKNELPNSVVRDKP